MQAGPILLVEDDRDTRESLLHALRAEGYSAVGATDAVDAMEQLRSSAPLPRLMIVDLMMPRVSVAAFRENIAQVPEWSAIPLVIVSADDQARFKAEQSRAAGFLNKPVKLERLFDVVTQVLESAPIPPLGGGSQFPLAPPITTHRSPRRVSWS